MTLAERLWLWLTLGELPCGCHWSRLGIVIMADCLRHD
jgi:hypothetical protein